MPFLPEITVDTAPEESQQTFGRIRDMLETEDVPGVFLRMGHVPSFLKDVYMNFKKFVYSEGKLERPTRAAIALAVASYQKCRPWMDYLSEHGRSVGLTDEQVAEVVAVSSINATYNAFFKFRSIAGSDIFEGMPVGLRAHTFAGVSLDDKTVELISIAISDVNACKPCVAGHVTKARKLEIPDEAILEAVQCASAILAAVQYVNAADA